MCQPPTRRYTSRSSSLSITDRRFSGFPRNSHFVSGGLCRSVCSHYGANGEGHGRSLSHPLSISAIRGQRRPSSLRPEGVQPRPVGSRGFPLHLTSPPVPARGGLGSGIVVNKLFPFFDSLRRRRCDVCMDVWLCVGARLFPHQHKLC